MGVYRVNYGVLLFLRAKSRIFMGIMGLYHGLLGLEKGNNMYDGPPAP